MLGVQNPTWFDFQLLADTFLLIVLHGHMHKFLGMGEEFIFMKKIFLMPDNFLAFFVGLVGINIKNIFIFKCARCAIGSDY